eukprot:14352923-Alexandrium_andersonii.AAC.1
MRGASGSSFAVVSGAAQLKLRMLEAAIVCSISDGATRMKLAPLACDGYSVCSFLFSRRPAGSVRSIRFASRYERYSAFVPSNTSEIGN